MLPSVFLSLASNQQVFTVVLKFVYHEPSNDPRSAFNNYEILTIKEVVLYLLCLSYFHLR